ncbi:MAG: nitronate monooxygenase [Peptococcaceae bacterium]|nr:nitronate monooxygenase [Peptococcaceae bacterium]
MGEFIFKWPGKGFAIGDLQIPVPIVQGGMGIGVSARNLAVAVANQGGIGVISAVGMGYLNIPCEIEPHEGDNRNITIMRQEIRKARQQTNGVLGVNIMAAIREFTETATAAIEEGIDVIFAGAGLPLNLPSCLKEGSKTKLVPIISSAKAAKLIAKRWMTKYNYVPDAFVLEGPKAGGHLGFSVEQIENPDYQLEVLIPQVVEAVHEIEQETGKQIPIIAGGGIYTGEDIYQAQQLGADAVQMATRFVATEECDADDAFKQAYVNCTKEDIGIIQSPVGLPGRAIQNEFLTKAKAGLKHPKVCARHCITTCKAEASPYCISSALLHAVHGRLEEGFAFIGANGYRVDRILTVPALLQELADGYAQQIAVK